MIKNYFRGINMFSIIYFSSSPPCSFGVLVGPLSGCTIFSWIVRLWCTHRQPNAWHNTEKILSAMSFFILMRVENSDCVCEIYWNGKILLSLFAMLCLKRNVIVSMMMYLIIACSQIHLCLPFDRMCISVYNFILLLR